MNLRKLVRDFLARFRAARSEQAGGANADDEVEIDIIGTDSLYPDPVYRSADELTGQAAHRMEFEAEGPSVILAYSVLAALTAHAEASPGQEVGGLCLGQVFRLPTTERFLICVDQIVAAEHTMAGTIAQGDAYLTFTADAWRALIDAQQREFPNLRVLGWYHSHPGFGVFLSSLDLFIHDHFFPAAWQLALVIDPVQRQLGVFARCAEKTQSCVLTWAVPAALAESDKAPVVPGDQRE